MTFEVLIEKIKPKLKGIVYKMHAPSYSFSVEDLYQEAVLQLWVDYNDGKLSDKTDSYVLQSSYFYLKNYLRKFQDKTSPLNMDMPISEEPLPVDQEPDIDALMEKVFNESLNRKEKEITFFYLQGWTTREIAQRLGLSHVSIVKLEEKIREKCKKSKNSV